MNARTIQHPGIEIREIDMTEYKDTVTTNNAYVIGFTDRGPIYDYSWITTRSEFINLYGEPQTEAEKYLYYAVQSILTNGGTPIVARMPYDNKQCKSYKALKVKFASIAEDENSDTGFTLYDWNNDAEFTSTASALIDLDLVGTKVAPEGFNSVLETLNHKTVTMTDAAGAELTVNPKTLTYKNLLLSLDKDLRLAADLADDTWTLKFVEIYDNLQKMINYCKVPQHDLKCKNLEQNISSTYNNILAANAEFEEVLEYFKNETYPSVSAELAASGWEPPVFAEYFLSDDDLDAWKSIYWDADGNLISTLKESGSIGGNVLANLPAGLIENIRNLNGLVTDPFDSFSNPKPATPLSNCAFSPVDVLEAWKTKLSLLNDLYIDAKVLGGKLKQDYPEFADLQKLKDFLNAGVVKHDTTVSGVINAINPNNPSCVFPEVSKVCLSGFTIRRGITTIHNSSTAGEHYEFTAGKITKAPKIGAEVNAVQLPFGISISGELINSLSAELISSCYIYKNTSKISDQLSSQIPGAVIFAPSSGSVAFTGGATNNLSGLWCNADEFDACFKDKNVSNEYVVLSAKLSGVQAESGLVAYKDKTFGFNFFTGGVCDIPGGQYENKTEKVKAYNHSWHTDFHLSNLTPGSIRDILFGKTATPVVATAQLSYVCDYNSPNLQAVLESIKDPSKDLASTEFNPSDYRIFKVQDSSNPQAVLFESENKNKKFIVFKDGYIEDYPELDGILSAKFESWINVAVYHKQLDILETIKAERSNYIKVNGHDPADLGIPYTILKEYVNDGVFANSIKNLINKNLLAEDEISKLNVNELAFENSLARIFNDPAFSPVGTKGQAIIDSHLLTTPELSYEYGVYLDSCECNISNEQYDDLVTTNNFTKADMTVSKFGEDINNANFIIVDKQKTIVDGIGSNQGYFITLVDPYDALKMQRLMVNPCQQFTEPDETTRKDIKYYGLASKYAWKKAFKNEINTLNTLQRIKNADGIWIGEPGKPGKEQLLDSWSMPLAADYYNASISKDLMSLFPSIPLTDVAASVNSDTALCTIDKQYSSHIVVAVCKTIVNPSDGKITVSIVEQFFGSLFDEKNVQNGRDLYIGNIINANSNYIEFYRNNYIKPAFGGGMDPEPYNRTPVPQFFIKQSAQLNNAAKMAGIDSDNYDVDNVLSEAELIAQGKQSYQKYIEELRAANIFIFDKKNTIFYNNHPEAVLTSFSKKEAQKVIANTTGLFGQEAGTTSNIGNNFIIDMDRCISFVKNVDDIPIYFVADAGLSTIAQFCDNVVWDQEANHGNGKWVTQNFDPDNDPDGEDRYIQQYTDVATWRKVVDKLDQISREIRKDCMTIIDAPRMLTLDGSAPKIRRSKPQNNWDDVIGDKLRFISGINSSYTAGYYNWLRTTDEFSGNAFWLPPTCKIIGNYMYLNVLNLPWLAPAGLNYGVITGIHGISHNPSPQEEDQIYMKSWNYIKQYPFDGFIIEGQKTTLTKNSAFNRVNVRTLFLDLERYVYNVARTFKYTVNNQYTREQFVQTIKPKFEDYVLRHGLYDYRIVCNDTNNTPETIDRNELRCAIYLKPARLVEFIMLDFIAAKTGANFDEIIL